MRIGAVGFSSYQNYIGGISGAMGVGSADGVEKPTVTRNPGESDVKAAGRTSAPSECKTCQNRKYQDGSDEQVSFKSAAHISPEASAARVRGHEQEHVSNAYKEAAEKGGKVLNASVALKTAICPECGRSYVAGGTTTTQIKYSKDADTNPYAKNMKATQGDAVKGQNLDLAV